MASAPVLSPRALNRATLDRQSLLRRAPRAAMDAEAAVRHLVGLQAQNVRPPYLALAARLAEFDPGELSALMAERQVARLVTLRSTLHTHTADDALGLRPLAQPALERELRAFRSGLVGVDLDMLRERARELVEEEPRTMKELRRELLVHWPDADPFSLSLAARCVLPLVQTTPRGLWGRGGQVTLTTAGHWFGREPGEPVSRDDLVTRYLAAFGPASVKDAQTWSGLTRLREVFTRLRPGLVVFRDERGTELFDLPDAPRPGPDTPAPPRFLPEYDNLLLSHADRGRVIARTEHRELTWRGNQSYPTLLVDGFLAGIWRLTETEGSATLVVQPFEELSRARREQVAAEGERTLATLTDASSYDIRFGRFLD
ncbi:winged helix DNA-binding domain-containing protein [Streptomyces sp. NPDC057638]|uniref:winged helix DNA-binding domain-containing protein n=1 Tax=Streptomyces sp. NPDC057638 TaxID=3346190 RepID=UPI0036903D5E